MHDDSFFYIFEGSVHFSTGHRGLLHIGSNSRFICIFLSCDRERQREDLLERKPRSPPGVPKCHFRFRQKKERAHVCDHCGAVVERSKSHTHFGGTYTHASEMHHVLVAEKER